MYKKLIVFRYLLNIYNNLYDIISFFDFLDR